jgi:hypothetical protein
LTIFASGHQPLSVWAEGQRSNAAILQGREHGKLFPGRRVLDGDPAIAFGGIEGGEASAPQEWFDLKNTINGRLPQRVKPIRIVDSGPFK